jgi:hypothetical protein
MSAHPRESLCLPAIHEKEQAMADTVNLNVLIPPDLIEAARRSYSEQTHGKGLPEGPSALVRYALAVLAGQDAVAWAGHLPKGPGSARRRYRLEPRTTST